jgi:hypothetical protein
MFKAYISARGLLSRRGARLYTGRHTSECLGHTFLKQGFRAYIYAGGSVLFVLNGMAGSPLTAYRGADPNFVQA